MTKNLHDKIKSLAEQANYHIAKDGDRVDHICCPDVVSQCINAIIAICESGNETDAVKIIKLLEEYKSTCMEFATESHRKGNRTNAKYWTDHAKYISKILMDLTLRKDGAEWLELYFELYNTGWGGRIMHPKMKQFREELKADEKLDAPVMRNLNICSWCVQKALDCWEPK